MLIWDHDIILWNLKGCRVKIYHLNCGTLCPFTGKFLANRLALLKDNFSLVCHCLLIETNQGLVLVDTGLGLNDIAHARKIYTSLMFGNFAKPLLDPNETAFVQVQRLGFKASDVRHIITTHLDCDHTGGIDDFPNAKVHVLADEWDAAFKDQSLNKKLRYFPDQFSREIEWCQYKVTAGEAWNGFEAVRELEGLPPEILMIPLPGHTRGHAGVAIEGDQKTLFFAGDAYLHRNQILGIKPPLYVKLYNKFMQVDLDSFESNLNRLIDLQRSDKQVDIFCSHDPEEFDCLYSSKPLRT